MTRKKPGKSNRKGITLTQLFEMFPDDEAAKEWFAKVRWPDGMVCPHCESKNIQTNVKHKTQDYRCRTCRKWFSVRTGTVMKGSKLGLQMWMVAVYLLSTSLKGQSSMKLHRDLGVSQPTAWYLAHRIRESWDDEQGLFTGPVEVDETYMGGKRRNMSNSKRKELTGRGPVGKTAVIGAKDRATNSIAAEVIESTDAETLEKFVVDHANAGAMVYTDDASVYDNIPFVHTTVKHSVAEFVRDQAHTNGIESFWSMLKRGHKGIYHQMSVKHLHRYVNEYAGRHNLRECDIEDQMKHIAKNMVGKELRYQDLVT